MTTQARQSTWRTALGIAVIALATIGVGLTGAAQATGSGRSDHDTKHDETIVRVTGDAANGFGVYYHDGSEIFPPTGSEAIAECTEYDSRIRRVRCKVEVRTWYRDLTEMKRTIRYIRDHPNR